MAMVMIGKEKFQCTTEENNMLLTEKQLRNTIRKLILENQEHYEKLAILITSGDFESINQAIDLADTLGYLELIDSDVRDLKFDNRKIFIFSLRVTEEFKNVMLAHPAPPDISFQWDDRFEFLTIQGLI